MKIALIWKAKYFMGYYSIQEKKMCSPPKTQDETHSYVKQFYYIDRGKKQLRQIQLNILIFLNQNQKLHLIF